MPMPSTPGGPAQQQDGDGDDDDDVDDEMLVPPTPVAARSPSQPETPLTPLSTTLVEDDDDDDPAAHEPDALPGNDNNNNDDTVGQELFATAEGSEAVIRGTDIHVPTAAAAFQEFLRTFQSLHHARRAHRRHARQGNPQGHSDDENDDDDSSMDDHDDDDDEDVPPLYLSKLQALVAPTPTTTTTADEPTSASFHATTACLELDARHLYFHNPDCQRLYHQLAAYPTELIPVLDICAQRQFEDLHPTSNLRIQVRPFNLQSVSNLRTLDPIHMDSLVGVQGMIVRTSPILPDLKVAHFSCTLCGHDVQVAVDGGRIAEPSGKCANCNAKASSSYQLVHNRSLYSDKQVVRLQETPDQVPAGHTPASCLLFAFDDLCDQVLPGDRVEVTAILRAQPVRTHPKLSKLKTLYKTYLDVVHYRKISGMRNNHHAIAGSGTHPSTKRGNPPHASSPSQHQEQQEQQPEGHQGAVSSQWSAQRIAQLHELSRQPDIYHKLVQSLAPSIWELDNVKKGVLCMLFGGNSGYRKDSQQQEQQQDSWWEGEEDHSSSNPTKTHTKESTHKRGDINILLCGDPGTSKSQLLAFVHKLSHRGVYTSGKGSSAVGLTASVVRDPETRDLVLESGALVLSDLGICCIDEL